MSTPSSAVALIAPDGTVGTVPRENAAAAYAAGAKPAMQLRSPNGDLGIVPFDQFPAAVKAGAMTEGSYQDKLKADQKVPSSALSDIASFATRAGKGSLDALVGAGKGLYQTATDGQGMNGLAKALIPGEMARRMVIAPQIDQFNQARQITNSPDYKTDPQVRLQAGAHMLASLIPGAGPMAAQTGDAMRPQIEQGNYAGAAGTLGTNALLAYLGGKVGGKLLETPTNVTGQNYTPAHAAAFEGLTAKANGMGPNFIPQNLTSDALSPIRQSASDMLANGSPIEQEIARTATGKGVEPLDRIGAVHSVIQKSLSDLEAQHAPVLAQNSGVPVDMEPIQKGLRAQIKPGMSDADIAGINDLIQRSGQITNLGDLNNFRQIMNEEASPSYRQTPTRAGQASAPQQVATDAANAVRAHYFDQMQKATVSPQKPTGIDFQPLKSQESKLLTTKEAIERIQSPEAKAEAIFNAGGKSARERIGDVANIIKDPRTTVTQTLLRESPATRSANLIRASLRDLPSANAPNIAQASIPQGQISGAQPPLLSNSPPTIQGTAVQPPPPPNVPPQIAAAIQQQLEARSQGQLQLPAPQQAAYPALNDAAARTRITPNQFNSPSEAGANGASPAGTLNPLQRFLEAGDLEKNITNPSTDDLKRAIAGMRKRRGK